MHYRIYLVFIILFGLLPPAGATVPNVVVTIKPIHSLVAGVMAGLKPPRLLMGGEGSPHTHPLEPNHVRQIEASNVLVWVGPSYESSLRGVIRSLKKNHHVITLMKKPGMILYPIRQGKEWGSHDHCDEQGHVHDHEIDGHLWLDTDNAKTIVITVAKELSSLDPKNAPLYQKNSEHLIKRLVALDDELQKMLKPVRHIPYVVYHDGTQYFDAHFQTTAVGVLIGDSHFGVNAQHLLKMLDYIRTEKVGCIFTEPQFSTDKIASILDQTKIKIQTLDYLGVHLKADQEAYFVMMRELAGAFVKGLKS